METHTTNQLLVRIQRVFSDYSDEIVQPETRIVSVIDDSLEYVDLTISLEVEFGFPFDIKQPRTVLDIMNFIEAQ